ncbi:hypothetical protein TPHA_0C01740 [Tetrapisispora phaffii CBS 4417]|uniref:RRM domain-containing protein n=1 Tax=Tetrapisispora phaffii (strain ATCC 24235 / CBS 4417 / NBRC 1672 / NRRL Y-8282 / UCD 70-5) TaxID=1071381 RepID=G8BRF4_TETPH|nr:hypothetical protein TPHA_0C01740 [Tetrapisispora phaffii CBS 4417]CCE62330.1 hypothetical protein TPHA_0C01740 [Tetrapisispora phaffii CBS 4417]
MSEAVEGKIASPSKIDNEFDLKTLFVRSIPLQTTDDEFTDFFSNFAPLKHAVIVKDTNKKSRGFGFVSFASEEDSQEALTKARTSKIQNHLLRVDFAKRRDRSKTRTEGSEQTKEIVKKTFKKSATERDDGKDEDKDFDEESSLKGKPKLIIRNMPWSCRDSAKLKNIFSRYGTVDEATIPRKRDGKLCGFAFVTFKNLANCKVALEKSKGLKIDGRAVAVDFAVQKNRWENIQKQQDTQQEETNGPDSDSSSDSEEDDDDDDNDKEGEDKYEDMELDSDEEVYGESDEEEEEKPRRQQNRQEDYSVFIRNVPYDATEESLAEHFTKFGDVKYALPVIDRNTGLAKGTAFVAFKDQKAYEYCIANAPAAGSTSLLIGDDVLPEYVYEGRVLSVTPTVQRDVANRMAEKNAEKRKELLGKAPGERDRRNLYLLNEGRVAEGTKLAQLLSKTDMEIREKSYSLRVEQLKKNPSLHISMTRLAIRNLPRAMTEKSLKYLARRAVVNFATEVNENKRHPLSKEEIVRSTKEKYKFLSDEEIERLKKKDKKQGLVKQSKIIMEVKGTTIGRSRGYGFVEYKDHKSALMGLRWLNVHAVTKEEILDGLTEEEKKAIAPDMLKSRRLVVEFAIENANVVKRRRENIMNSKEQAVKRKLAEDAAESAEESKKAKIQSEDSKKNGGMSDNVRSIIGQKRKRRSAKK